MSAHPQHRVRLADVAALRRARSAANLVAFVAVLTAAALLGRPGPVVAVSVCGLLAAGAGCLVVLAYVQERVWMRGLHEDVAAFLRSRA